MKCNKSPYAIWIKAYDRSPVTNINLEDCSFDGVANPNILEGVKDLRVKEVTINNVPFTN